MCTEKESTNYSYEYLPPLRPDNTRGRLGGSKDTSGGRRGRADDARIVPGRNCTDDELRRTPLVSSVTDDANVLKSSREFVSFRRGRFLRFRSVGGRDFSTADRLRAPAVVMVVHLKLHKSTNNG